MVFISLQLNYQFHLRLKRNIQLNECGIQPYSVPMFIVVFIIIIIIGLPTVGTETQIHKESYY